MKPRVALWAHRLRAAEQGTGLGRYVVELTRALSERQAGGRSSCTYDLRSVAEGEPPAWLPDGLPFVPLRAPRKALHLAWTAVRWPSVEAVSAPADLVHSLYPSFPCPSRAPFVASIFDTYTIDHPDWYGRMEGWAGRRALRHAADEASRIVVSSTWSADRVREALGVEAERLEVVPAGVAAQPGEVDPAAIGEVLTRFGLVARGYVIAVGAVTWRKNLAVAVRALAEQPDLRLVLAGPHEPAPTAALVAEVERLRLAERVRLLGPVPEADLWALLAGSLGLVHPSLSEGFGFTPLEAMAAGVPAIAARAGSLPEVLGDAATLVDPHDVAAWAAALHALADHPEHRDAQVAAGRARAASYTWARTAEMTARVHDSVVHGCRPRQASSSDR